MENNMKPEHTKLNMGCGFNKLNDHWNVDVEARCNPDEVVDFDVTPWPYDDNFFDKITASNVLEHLGRTPDSFLNILKEMYRVSQDGAEWAITVPHHRCDVQWDDPTHVRTITAGMFLLFDQQYNTQAIERKLGRSPLGLYNKIDLEVIDVQHQLIGYWREQLEKGMLGHGQLEVELNTKSNVAESVTMFVKVHKPGRFESYLK